MAIRLEEFTEVSEVLSSGVYALVRSGIVVYVGQSRSLYQRIYSHRRRAASHRGVKPIPYLSGKSIQFDQVFIRPCPLADLDSLEYEMINKYKPRYNEKLKNGLKITTPIKLVVLGVELKMNEPAPAPITEPMRRL